MCEDGESGVKKSAVDLYFLSDVGDTFKATLLYAPYFYVGVAEPTHSTLPEVESYLRRRFESSIAKLEPVWKEDMLLLNHLSGLRRRYLKLSFHTIHALMAVRADLLPLVATNRRRRADGVDAALAFGVGAADVDGGVVDFDDFAADNHHQAAGGGAGGAGDEHGASSSSAAAAASSAAGVSDAGDLITDIREYDVPYYMRVAIDLDIRCGKWFDVQLESGAELSVRARDDLLERPDMRICAFDIECTKEPLRFPDANLDHVMMISYMLDTDGYLIVNRDIVGEDIADFEYTPKPEYEGRFTVFNERDEKATLERFFSEMRAKRPHIYVTFNGDFFDWPFIERRAREHGISLMDQLGVREVQGEYRGRFVAHMDAFQWVERDSYLPQGSRGLKAVTRKKLGYDPLELDPEDMLPFATEKPQLLASYSVSDAVATYYLYMKYVHPFIFSLCNVIPMNPDDTLRKGSGTLCEALLMVEATHANVIYPNKMRSETGRTYKGHLLESETYVGGHVECLLSGVYRADVPMRFDLDAAAVQTFIDEAEQIVEFGAHEAGLKRADVANFADVVDQVCAQLADLRDAPRRAEPPLIYHLDVAAMYPNIILTYRLQPTAIVTPDTCAACDFNQPESRCQLQTHWTWRGDYIPASASEVRQARSQLEVEMFAPAPPEQPWNSRFGQSRAPPLAPPPPPPPLVPGAAGASKARRSYIQLSLEERDEALRKRLKQYSQTVYKKSHIEIEEERKATVCQRENSFYVDTVRAFRDRRYDYKREHKTWQANLAGAKTLEEQIKARNMVIIYDSLQLAHKCILNSFYGYVMRRGARWYSMEMAGIVTHTGAQIIKMAKEMICKVGRPLELDTDGIWCVFPRTFPENFELKPVGGGKARVMSFPCAMLNRATEQHFSNDQYQDLQADGTYAAHRECSIAFEVDGPYRAMMLPASNKLGKGGATVKLKKRYAVFNSDRSLAELKGFELKRRGELKLIKIFQEEVFDKFLDGASLAECYAAVAAVADKWLDVIDTRGRDMDDPVLLELITEASTMSKQLVEYGEQKSSRVTTAKRLAEMLGESVVRDKGLNCSYVVSRYPAGAPVSQRAIPVVVFKADEAVRRDQLRKWLQSSAITDYSIRTILDWDYYRGRLVGVVQKLVTIPAFYQGLVNPVPRCAHPDWLLRDGSVNDTLKQQKLSFKPQSAEERTAAAQRELARLQAENPIAPRAAAAAAAAAGGRVRGGKKVKFDPSHDDVELEGVEAMPDRAVDYGLWIKWMKRQWRMQRRARAELRKQLGISDAAQAAAQAAAAATQAQKDKASKLAAASVGLPPKLALALRMHPQLVHDWHVVEIAPAFDVEWRGSGASQQMHVVPAPDGEFTAWAMIEGTLRSLRISVPRRFYVNSRASDAGNADNAVRLHPPRGHARHQLYEFSMAESDFVANKRSMSNYFSSELIEGVYETGTPLLFRALYELGSVAHVQADQRWNDHYEEDDEDDDGDADELIGVAGVGALNHGKAERGGDTAFVRELRHWRQRQRLAFSIDQLAAASKAPSLAAYLAGAERQLQRAFLYHADAGARGVLALVLPAPAGALRPIESATILVVGAANRDNARRAAAQFVRDSGVAADAVTVAVMRNMDEAFARIDRLLVEREAKRRAALLPRRRGKKAQQLAAAFDVPPSSTLTVVQTALTPAQLRARLPALHLTPLMPVVANDSDARTLAAARALEAWELTAATLVYKRHDLVAQQFDAQLRFARKTAMPLGNIAGDFLRLVSDAHLARTLRADGCLLWYSTSDRPDLGGAEVDEFQYVDELVNPRVSAPGCYSGVCVELDVIGMAINTMLEAPHILAEIGSTGALTFDGADERPIDSAHAARAAFASLRKLVTRWSIEVADDDVFEPLLANFYRWIADTHSLAYDPALHRMVHSLMERVFWRLIERFRKADLTVVYADFNRMIVATKAQRVELAQHRVRTLLDAIKQDNLFAWLDLAPAASGAEYESAWSTLVFYDIANYCGVPATPVGQAPLPIEQTEVRRHWNLATHLPATVAERFMAVVSSYALDVEKRRRDSAARGAAAGAAGAAGAKKQLDAEAALRESAPNAAESVLSRAMSITKDDALGDSGDTLLHDAAFRTLLIRFVSDATSDATASDKIEFVKAMCAVLSLDAPVREAVQLLKQMLLRPLGVTPFAPRAKFTDPCRTLTLPDVVCSYCYDQRDFDLLRDTAAAAGTLECARCHHPYSRIALEARLVAQLQRRAVAYQLQDVRCSSCRLVAADVMRATCRACSKPLELKMSPDELRDGIAVFGAVAQHHKFEWLANEVASLIETE